MKSLSSVALIGRMLIVWISVGYVLPGPALTQEKPARETVKTGNQIYRAEPRRKMTVFYPENWKATDRRPALVIFRCNIPEQEAHYRNLGMVVIKPETAPVNSGNLPKMSLEEIARSPKPRDQVADTKSAIRYIRANAAKLGIDPGKIVATGTSGGGDLALLSHLNQTFENPDDDLSVSASPDVLVLYSPAFDGIDIWFVKTATLLEKTRTEAPSFLPLLNRFVENAEDEYAQPLDHRAKLIELAAAVGLEKGIDPAEVERFQGVLQLFNERDWQLLNPAADELTMSASRILSNDRPLPPTLILLGDRDHLAPHQTAFVARARELGQSFDLKVYPGGGHSFMMMPAFIEPSNQEIDRFLEREKILPVE